MDNFIFDRNTYAMFVPSKIGEDKHRRLAILSAYRSDLFAKIWLERYCSALDLES
ncbi:hypothetical protein D3C74_123360 [compost metagenome]